MKKFRVCSFFLLCTLFTSNSIGNCSVYEYDQKISSPGLDNSKKESFADTYCRYFLLSDLKGNFFIKTLKFFPCLWWDASVSLPIFLYNYALKGKNTILSLFIGIFGIFYPTFSLLGNFVLFVLLYRRIFQRPETEKYFNENKQKLKSGFGLTGMNRFGESEYNEYQIEINKYIDKYRLWDFIKTKEIETALQDYIKYCHLCNLEYYPAKFSAFEYFKYVYLNNLSPEEAKEKGKQLKVLGNKVTITYLFFMEDLRRLFDSSDIDAYYYRKELGVCTNLERKNKDDDGLKLHDNKGNYIDRFDTNISRNPKNVNLYFRYLLYLHANNLRGKEAEIATFEGFSKNAKKIKLDDLPEIQGMLPFIKKYIVGLLDIRGKNQNETTGVEMGEIDTLTKSFPNGLVFS